LFAWLQIDQNAQTKEEQAAKLRIPRTRVEFVDLRMGTDSSFVKLTGRVRNNDPRFTLTYVELDSKCKSVRHQTDARPSVTRPRASSGERASAAGCAPSNLRCAGGRRSYKRPSVNL